MGGRDCGFLVLPRGETIGVSGGEILMKTTDKGTLGFSSNNPCLRTAVVTCHWLAAGLSLWGYHGRTRLPSWSSR